MTLKDNSKDALADFIERLSKSFLKWYNRSVRRYATAWTALQSISLTSSFLTSIFAALMTEDAFKGLGWGRLVLVILPATGAAVSNITVQAKLYELYQLRERGRTLVQELCLQGERRFAAAKNDDEFLAIHEELETKLNKIEAEQGQGFFSFVRH